MGTLATLHRPQRSTFLFINYLNQSELIIFFKGKTKKTRGIQCSFMIWIAIDHEHTEDDPG